MLRFRMLSAAILLSTLTACSMIGESARTIPGAGLVVGDEPEAVEAGAQVLAHGGDAVDAAAATYFELAVTYPVAAGLGGGGQCIVHDAKRSRTEAFDFLARQAAQGGLYAVPGNVSGFSLLQMSYGRLPWQRVVSPGESAAAAGFVISQALADRLAASQNVIRLDAGLAAEFLDEAGHVRPAGTRVLAPELAQSLATIRTFGPAGFYRGAIASGIVAYSAREGGAITTGELASYAPQRDRPAIATVESQTVYLPASGTGAGKFAATLLSHLVNANDRSAPRGNLIASVASATKASLDSFGIASLPRDLGATGFAAEDSDGLAIACAVTMNGPFGSGHTASGTGITLAHAPNQGEAGLAAAFLTPVIAVSDGNVSLAGAGAGGPNGTAGMALALLRIARGEDVTKPGVLHSTGIAPYDTINVIACTSGACAAVPDPGGHGLGASGEP
ncbi:MAG TPA: gamma-glutamyltransferase [Rhizomicrobium sp.]